MPPKSIRVLNREWAVSEAVVQMASESKVGRKSKGKKGNMFGFYIYIYIYASL